MNNSAIYEYWYYKKINLGSRKLGIVSLIAKLDGKCSQLIAYLHSCCVSVSRNDGGWCTTGGSAEPEISQRGGNVNFTTGKQWHLCFFSDFKQCSNSSVKLYTSWICGCLLSDRRPYHSLVTLLGTPVQGCAHCSFNIPVLLLRNGAWCSPLLFCAFQDALPLTTLLKRCYFNLAVNLNLSSLINKEIQPCKIQPWKKAFWNIQTSLSDTNSHAAVRVTTWDTFS